jgi:hypothetical protein
MGASARSELRATAGDRLLVQGHRVGEPERRGEVVEVLGEQGEPPYLVRWEGGHVSRVYPGPDVHIEHMVNKSDRGEADV